MRDRPRVRMNAGRRRELILEEATKMIRERGVFAFTVQELAQRCGLTNAGLLHHFPTKEDILVGVLNASDHRMNAELPPEVRIDAGGIEIIRDLSCDEAIAVLRDTLKAKMKEPQLLRLHSVLRNESLSDGHPAQDFFRERDKLASKLCAQVFGKCVRDPESFARKVFALTSGLEEQWLRVGPSFDLLAEWDRGVDSLLNGAALPGIKWSLGPGADEVA